MASPASSNSANSSRRGLATPDLSMPRYQWHRSSQADICHWSHSADNSVHDIGS